MYNMKITDQARLSLATRGNHAVKGKLCACMTCSELASSTSYKASNRKRGALRLGYILNALPQPDCSICHESLSWLPERLPGGFDYQRILDVKGNIRIDQDRSSRRVEEIFQAPTCDFPQCPIVLPPS